VISLAVAWFLQDIAQVLSMGVLLVPDFFILAVAYGIVSGPLGHERISILIWLAFAGGILWDFRWTATPGISGLVNSLAVLAIYTAWARTPLAGRGVWLFALLAGTAHLSSGAMHYIAWGATTHTAVKMFLAQQLLGIPAVAAVCAVYLFGTKNSHV
jgi:signal transduction histidine kinase